MEPLVPAGIRNDIIEEGGLTLATQVLAGVEPVDTSRFECIDGQLEERPVPNISHSRITDNVSFLLRPLVRSRGMESGPELSINKAPGTRADWMTPDYAVSPPGGYHANANGNALPPVLLVVEVLSPGQTFFNMRLKAERYLAWGVQHVWLLDGDSASALVFHFDQPGSSQIVSAGELQAGELNIPLSEVFA